MARHPQNVPGGVALRPLVLLALSVCLAPRSGRAEPEPRTCAFSACIYLRYDPELSAEAGALAETLRRRLCKRGVQIYTEPRLDGGEPGTGRPRQPVSPETAECVPPRIDKPSGRWWNTHLRLLSDTHLLVAVDYLAEESDEDLIREVPRGADPRATAWTLALMIEEAVLPYLEPDGDQAPLGAGLAIIEPSLVGGVKKPEPETEQKYPEFRCLGLGLLGLYLGSVADEMNDLLVGPRASVQGLLGPRITASIAAGWVGTGSFSNVAAEVKGSVSHLPIEILFGFLVLDHRIVSIDLLVGISTGFSIFKTSSTRSNEQRTDLLFAPWPEVLAEVSFRLFGPIAVVLHGGAAFPIRIDVLREGGEEVYREDWVLPEFGIGLQLWI